MTTGPRVPTDVRISLRAVDGAGDRPLLARWLVLEHVQQWWGDPALNLADFDQQPTAQHVIVAAGGEPIGYIRWRLVRRHDLAEVGGSDMPDIAADIDLFIGEPAWLGRGAGPAALSLLLTVLRADPPVPLAIVSTSVRNARAIRAYEKAGFRQYRQYDDPESGKCWMMTVSLLPPPQAPGEVPLP